MMDAPSDLVFYTTFEVAELLHLSVSRVRQLIRTGRLKARVHRGRCNVKRLCVLQSDLRDFLHNDFLEQYWAGHRSPAQMTVNSAENTGIK